MRRLIGVLLLTLFGQRAIAAQGATDSDRSFGTIDGIVTDTALAPLAGASVTLLSSGIRVETEASGRFRLRIRAGQYILIVRHFGHRPASDIIDVPAGDTARLSYMLGPASGQLERTVVTDQRLVSEPAEFEQRRRLGRGEFLTQSDIDRRNALQTADLFRQLNAVTLLQTKWGYFIVGRTGCASAVRLSNAKRYRRPRLKTFGLSRSLKTWPLIAQLSRPDSSGATRSIRMGMTSSGLGLARLRPNLR